MTITTEAAAALDAIVKYWLANGGAADAEQIIAANASRTRLTSRWLNAVLADGEVSRDDVVASIARCQAAA